MCLQLFVAQCSLVAPIVLQGLGLQCVPGYEFLILIFSCSRTFPLQLGYEDAFSEGPALSFVGV